MLDLELTRHARIEELDGLRGIAVLGVMLWHFTGSLVVASESTINFVLQHATVWGRTGVDLFFVLSGFLIIGILVDRQDSPNVFRVFYLRRIMRIFPPYFTLIAAYWIGYAWFGESPAFNTHTGGWTQFLAQISFTWNWLMALTNGPVARAFSVTWSVAIEEWFYILAPWVIVALPQRHLASFLIAIGTISIVARAGFYLTFPKYGLAPYILPMFRLDGLCAGGLVALGVRSPRVLAFLGDRKAALALLSLLFAVSIPPAIAAIRSNLDFHMYMWGHTYLALAFATIIAWTYIARGGPSAAFLRARILRLFGRYSYTLYLFHPLFISTMFMLAGNEAELIYGYGDVLVALVAFAGSLAFAILFYQMIEARFLRAGRKYDYASKNARAPE